MKSHPFTLYFDEIYSSGLDRTARFPVDRYSMVAEKLIDLDKDQRINWAKPRLATKEEILSIHDQAYVERFLSHQLGEKEIRRIGLRPWKKAIVERTLRLTGGALDALECVTTGGHKIAGNMAGGTHHAFRGEGAGYCIFNDLAVCAAKALNVFGLGHILILDLDVHQGDGTAKIFESNQQVYTVSLHGKNNFPFRKQISDYDVEVENETGDGECLKVLEGVLHKLSAFQFDLIFFQAGVDGLASDALGLLQLSRKGLLKRNDMVFSWRESMALPMVIFMGGGYAKPIEDSVYSFTDLFLEAGRRVV